MTCVQTAVDNPLLYNREQYDRQMWEPETAKCVFCHERIPNYDMVRVGDNLVCGDCLHDYCEAQFPMLGAQYLEENEQDYLSGRFGKDSEELFLNWWLLGLEKTDRARILKDAFFREKQADPEFCAAYEKAFCVQSLDWEAFVKKNL